MAISSANPAVSNPNWNAKLTFYTHQCMRLCAAVLVAMQIVFLLYLVSFYGTSLLLMKPQLWLENSMLPQGYVAGDSSGNLLFGFHVFLSFIIVSTGLIQILPSVRKSYPRLHRYSGRTFLSLGIAAAIFGMALKLFRNDAGWLPEVFSPIGGNALLLIICAVQAWRHGRNRAWIQHQQWALRAFVVISAVWFLRVGFFSNFAVLSALGVASTSILALFPIWGVLSYLLPLGVLEIYWRSQTSGIALKIAACTCLALSTLMMLIGTFVMLQVSWLSLMRKGIDAWLS